MKGMNPKPKFEDIAATIELEKYRLKLPDRTAKLIIESPTLAQLDPGFSDFEQYQRNKAAEEVRRAELQKIAHETGAPVQLLRALENRPTPIVIDPSAQDEQHARAYQLGLDEEMMSLDNAVRAERNVQNVAIEARGMLSQAHRANPIHEIEFFDIGDDPEDVPVYQPNLHTPQVPITYRPSPEELAQMEREFQLTQPGILNVAGGVLQGVGQGVGSVARGIGAVAQMAPIVEAARGIYQVAAVGAPLVSGSMQLAPRLTSAASRNVANAMAALAQAGLPISHRGHNHLERAGVRIADSIGNFVVAHRL